LDAAGETDTMMVSFDGLEPDAEQNHGK